MRSLLRAVEITIFSCIAEGWLQSAVSAGPFRSDPVTSQKEDGNPAMNAGYLVAVIGL